MGKIIQTKFYCKGTSKSTPRGNLSNAVWVEDFIEGKWYDGEYELWYDEDESSEKNQRYFRMNGRWRRYSAINEHGKLVEYSKPMMNIIFELDLANNRNNKIEQILKK